MGGELEQKSIVVTGGLSGIGLSLVEHFSSTPSHISILDINPTSSIPVLSSLRASFLSTTFTFHKCDISSWEEQKSVFENIYKEAGRIDVVIANAGISEVGGFLKDVEEDGGPKKPEFRTLDVNLTGTLFTIKLAIHYMRKNTQKTSKGSIVCTASNAGLYPFPIAPMYAMSKHAVVGAVRSLARPLQQDGIRINGIAPACIATNLAPNPKLFNSMILTPVRTAINAVQEFVTNEELSGVIAEVSGDNYTFRAPPEHVDEDTGKNLEMFWTLGYA